MRHSTGEAGPPVKGRKEESWECDMIEGSRNPGKLSGGSVMRGSFFLHLAYTPPAAILVFPPLCGFLSTRTASVPHSPEISLGEEGWVGRRVQRLPHSLHGPLSKTWPTCPAGARDS